MTCSLLFTLVFVHLSTFQLHDYSDNSLLYIFSNIRAQASCLLILGNSIKLKFLPCFIISSKIIKFPYKKKEGIQSNQWN